MSSPSPPPAPDPNATAARAAETNRQSAVTQFGLNATNQVTPYGSLGYRQIGSWNDGTPRFEATQSLSAPEQEIYDINQATRRNVGTIGRDQSGRIAEHLSAPVNLDNDAVEGRLLELGRKRLDPMLRDRRAAEENKLANMGITMGSQAYNREVGRLSESENDAYNELLLKGRGQSVQEILTARNQPINEITALMSGSQVSQPSWVGTPQTSVAPTDYAGITQNAYQNQFQGWNAQRQSQDALMGGLFGLAAAPAGGFAYGKGRRG